MTNACPGWPRAIGKVAAAALEHAGIHLLEDLANYTEQEPVAIHGVGPMAICIVREALVEKGLAFRERYNGR